MGNICGQIQFEKEYARKLSIPKQAQKKSSELECKNIDGRYEILQTIGSGSSCKVKLAKSLYSEELYAIKIINSKIEKRVKDVVKSEADEL